MIKLSDTWLVAQISDSMYAINAEYSLGMIEMSKAVLKSPVKSNSFIKGIYDIYSVNMPVLDGRKLLKYNTLDDERLAFSQEISNIKCKHKEWIDDLEWSILTSDEFKGEIDPEKTALGVWLNDCKFDSDKLMTNLNKIKEPNRTLHSMAVKALGVKNGTENSGGISAEKIMEEIKRQSEKYIIKGLDAIIEIHNSDMDEMCIVLRCKDKDFALTVDRVVYVAEQSGKVAKNLLNRISAGTVEIRGQEINIINLTKLIGLIKY